MTNTKHTATPWRVGASLGTNIEKGIFSLTGYHIAQVIKVISGEGKANAAHIVKCVNMHDELVEALGEAYMWIHAFDKEDSEDKLASIKETLEKAKP